MSDQELIINILNGNSGAFRFLVLKYQRLVFHIVWQVVGDQAEVEDISQEVFIKVYKCLAKFKGESKLSTWIASITWKTTSDYLRKKSKSKLDFSEKPDVFESDYMNETQRDVNRNELKKMVNATIEKLPEQYKIVLTLFYLEEFSHSEINEVTGMPIGTIKSYLSRAREYFKNEIEKVNGEEAVQMLLND